MATSKEEIENLINQLNDVLDGGGTPGGGTPGGGTPGGGTPTYQSVFENKLDESTETPVVMNMTVRCNLSANYTDTTTVTVMQNLTIKSGVAEYDPYNPRPGVDWGSGTNNYTPSGSLESYISFNDIECIGGSLLCNEISNIKSLGLSALKSIGGYLEVSNLDQEWIYSNSTQSYYWKYGGILSTLGLSNLVSVGSSILIKGNSGLGLIEFPDLVYVPEDNAVISNNDCTSISQPTLELIGGSNLISREFALDPTNPAQDGILGGTSSLTTINQESLSYVGGVVYIANWENLTTVDHSSLTYVGGYLSVINNPNLTNYTLGSSISCPTYDFRGNGLSQESVDGILVSISNSVYEARNVSDVKTLANGVLLKTYAYIPSNLSYNSKTIRLDSGTNSTPGVEGLSAKAALIDAGWNVYTN